MRVRPPIHKGIPALAGYEGITDTESAGKTDICGVGSFPRSGRLIGRLPDIRDVPEASDTQRDKYLRKTEPLQGARPKWNKGGGGRPTVVPGQTGVLDIEAAGGVVGRNVEHRGAPTLCCHWLGRSCKRRK